MVQRRSDPREYCPACGGTLVNVQGLADCADCQWTDGRSVKRP